MPLVIWADETKPVPRPLYGAATCDGCGRHVELGEVGTDAWADARRAGFSISVERICCRTCAPAPDLHHLQVDAGPAPPAPSQLDLF